MVNKVLQSKALKRMRQIRKLPRPMDVTTPATLEDDKNFSRTPIPKRLLAEGVRAPSSPVRVVMQMYRNSAKSLEKEVRPDRFPGVPCGRKEAWDRMLKFQMDRVQSLVNSRLGFTIMDTSACWARVYRDPTGTKFVILYVNFKEHVIRTSMTYRFQKNIVDDFRADRLKWVEVRCFERG